MSPPLLSEYTPPNVDLLTERSNLNGMVIAGITYGIVFMLFAQCVITIISKDRRWASSWILYYTLALFISSTIGFAGGVVFAQMTYIDYRNYPGGPNMFTIDNFGHPVNLMVACAYVFVSWIADGLLIYRFAIIYKFSIPYLALPAAVFLGIIAMSLSLLTAAGMSGDGWWQADAIRFGIAYWSLSVALNVGITIAIAARLLIMGSRLRRYALDDGRSSPYLSIASMLVESASLYTVCALIFIVPYGIGSYVQNYILPSLGHAQAIASLLIIFRVCQGQAWDRDTMDKLTKTPASGKARSDTRGDVHVSTSIVTKVSNSSFEKA